MLANLGLEVFCLARLIGGLALEGGWCGKGGVHGEFVELGAEQGVLFGEVGLEGVDVGELVGEGLRGSGVLDEGVG